MKDVYDLIAFWTNRRQSPAQCAAAILRFLRGACEVDKFFSDWRIPARSERQALKRRFEPSLESISRRLTAIDPKNGWSDGSTLGFGFSLWSPGDGKRGMALSVRSGASSPKWRLSENVMSLAINGHNELLDDVLSLSKAKRLLGLVVDVWSPDVAHIAPSKICLDSALPREVPYVGWLTYIGSPALSLGESLPVASVEPMGPGTMFQLSEHRLVNGDSADMKMLEDLRAAMYGAGFFDRARFERPD